jgi:alanyl-tRNA synthetase
LPEDKTRLIAGVTADSTGKTQAGERVNFIAQQVGGKGSGRADMAQAGGTKPDKLPIVFASVCEWVSRK